MKTPDFYVSQIKTFAAIVYTTVVTWKAVRYDKDGDIAID